MMQEKVSVAKRRVIMKFNLIPCRCRIIDPEARMNIDWRRTARCQTGRVAFCLAEEQKEPLAPMGASRMFDMAEGKVSGNGRFNRRQSVRPPEALG